MHVKDTNPDWFLPVIGSPRISEVFYGYSDSLSLDHNPMVLVELKEFIQRYGTPIYAIDRVNGKMYHTFEGCYKLINEKAMLQPQYSLPTFLGSESGYYPTLLYEHTTKNNQYGYTYGRVHPRTSSRPHTFQAHSNALHVHDILEPSANEQARADYLEKQMRHMSSV